MGSQTVGKGAFYPQILVRSLKIQVVDRKKVGSYQARRAGFNTIQEFNAYLDAEVQRKEEKGFPVYNKGLVTIVHFTYLEGTSQNSPLSGGDSTLFPVIWDLKTLFMYQGIHPLRR